MNGVEVGYSGNSFEYAYTVEHNTRDGGSIGWQYNTFKGKRADGKSAVIRVKGIFNKDNKKYIDTLEITAKWFIEQLRRTDGVFTPELMKINFYGWIPAAYVETGRNLIEIPTTNKEECE